MASDGDIYPEVHQESLKKDAGHEGETFEIRMMRLEQRGADWFKLTDDFDPSTIQLSTLVSKINQQDFEFDFSIIHRAKLSYEDARTTGYVEALIRSAPRCEETMDQIEKDLPRTYPDLDFFADTDVHHMLRRILYCIATKYEQVGYVQGMNFVVSNLLWHTRSEDAALLLFCRLMDHPRYRLDLVYCPGLPKVIRYSKVLNALICNHLPNIQEHFTKLGLEPIYYSQRWIITLFSYSMPFPELAQVWDLFFQLGWEAMFRVALILLKNHEAEILDSDLDNTAQQLREIAEEPGRRFREEALALQLTPWEIRLIADSVAVEEDGTIPLDEEFVQTQGSIQSEPEGF